MSQSAYISSTLLNCFRKETNYRCSHQSSIGCSLSFAHFPYLFRYFKGLFHIIPNHQDLIGILANAHRFPICPLFEFFCNTGKIHPSVFDDCVCNAKHHISIIRPIAYLPAFTMPVLEDLTIMPDTIRILPCHIFICHTLCSKTEGIANGLTIYDSFNLVNLFFHISKHNATLIFVDDLFFKHKQSFKSVVLYRYFYILAF